MKRLYKGVFCWHGEDHAVYTHVKKVSNPFTIMIKKLSKKLDRSYLSVYNYFINTNKYSITLIKEEENAKS